MSFFFPPYATVRPVEASTVSFAKIYASELIRRSSTVPGPRDAHVFPGQRMGTKEGVEFVLEAYRNTKSYIADLVFSGPDSELASWGQCYGNITPMLTYMGWPSTPFGSTVTNAAAYAKERISSAAAKYEDLLREHGLDHVVKAREDYLATGVVPDSVMREWRDILEEVWKVCEPADKLHVRKDTNSGAPAFLSSARYKQSVILTADETSFAAQRCCYEGDLAKGIDGGVCALAVQGYRFQNDGAKKGENPRQPVEYEDPEFCAKNRTVLSYWRNELVIANKMSPDPRLAAERVRTVQAQAMASGFLLQVIANWFFNMRVAIPCIEYQDAIEELSVRYNRRWREETGSWEKVTASTRCRVAAGDLTGADHCHPLQIVTLFAEFIGEKIGDSAYAAQVVNSHAPCVTFSDVMDRSGARIIGDPSDPDTFGLMFMLASGEGTTAAKVVLFMLLYAHAAFEIMFRHTEEPWSMKETLQIMFDKHPRYVFTVKGDGWLIMVREFSEKRRKLEEHINALFGACLVYMEGGPTRDLGGYEMFIDEVSGEFKFANSATNAMNKLTLGDKDFNADQRPWAATGWVGSMGIYSSSPVLAGGADSRWVASLSEASLKTTGTSFRDSMLKRYAEEEAKRIEMGLVVSQSAMHAMLLADPARRVWDSRFMSEEFDYMDDFLFIELPGGKAFVEKCNNFLGSSCSRSFADDIVARCMQVWTDTFRNYSPEKADSIFPMSRGDIGDIISSNARRRSPVKQQPARSEF